MPYIYILSNQTSQWGRNVCIPSIRKVYLCPVTLCDLFICIILFFYVGVSVLFQLANMESKWQHLEQNNFVMKDCILKNKLKEKNWKARGQKGRGCWMSFWVTLEKKTLIQEDAWQDSKWHISQNKKRIKLFCKCSPKHTDVFTNQNSKTNVTVCHSYSSRSSSCHVVIEEAGH